MTGTPDEPNLQVSVERHGRTVIVSATGEIDLQTAPQLEQAAHDALADTPPALVIDLSGVTFLSSAGLTVLVRTHKLARDETEVRIVAADSATLRPLQLMGLDQELALYSARADATAEPSTY